MIAVDMSEMFNNNVYLQSETV